MANEQKSSFFGKLKSGLSRTRDVLFMDIGEVIQSSRQLDDDFIEELEDSLLMADVGISTTTTIIESLNTANKQSSDKSVYELLKQVLLDIFPEPDNSHESIAAKPKMYLMIGVNGAGKTTTIGKLGNYYKEQQQSVMLAAGDTFRAAAREQLQTWGERLGVPVMAHHDNADPASVIYDCLASARAKNIDWVIADTAGRLHTQDNLMEELKKIRRTINKFDETIYCETVLVLDATTGQNALNQAKQFDMAINIDSIVITKLDGSAKGGAVFSISHELKKPIRFIGVGEQMDDLQPFNASEFVEALLPETS